MRHLNQTKIFVSAETADATAQENALATFTLESRLTEQGFTFRHVNGCFDGRNEATFCVFATPGAILEALDTLVQEARSFGQDSVLVVHGDNAAELVECNTECSAILGTFQEVNTPEVGEDYTRADGKFYVVR